MLEKWRERTQSILDFGIKPFIKFNPNTLTFLSFIFAILAAFAFYFTQYNSKSLFLASLFIAISGFFDAIDGKLARFKNQTSAKGDFLDHLLDRYSDLLIIGGFALTKFCRPELALLGVIGTLFASYAGTQAQAVGIGRIYAGLLTRADRLVLLIFAPIAQYFLSNILILNFTILELTGLIFFILGQLTAVQRAFLTWMSFKQKS
ncbi:MAG: CDP-alcohol phosphatidyltransferase family protein [Candidatus Nanoarchaeia archaeon]